jgi:hypothetical protein
MLFIPFLCSIGDMNQPIKWDKKMAPSTPVATVEEKTVSEITKLNPFKTKVTSVLISLLMHFMVHGSCLAAA